MVLMDSSKDSSQFFPIKFEKLWFYLQSELFVVKRANFRDFFFHSSRVLILPHGTVKFWGRCGLFCSENSEFHPKLLLQFQFWLIHLLLSFLTKCWDFEFQVCLDSLWWKQWISPEILLFLKFLMEFNLYSSLRKCKVLNFGQNIRFLWWKVWSLPKMFFLQFSIDCKTYYF